MLLAMAVAINGHSGMIGTEKLESPEPEQVEAFWRACVDRFGPQVGDCTPRLKPDGADDPLARVAIASRIFRGVGTYPGSDSKFQRFVVVTLYAAAALRDAERAAFLQQVVGLEPDEAATIAGTPAPEKPAPKPKGKPAAKAAPMKPGAATKAVPMREDPAKAETRTAWQNAVAGGKPNGDPPPAKPAQLPQVDPTKPAEDVLPAYLSVMRSIEVTEAAIVEAKARKQIDNVAALRAQLGQLHSRGLALEAQLHKAGRGPDAAEALKAQQVAAAEPPAKPAAKKTAVAKRAR